MTTTEAPLKFTALARSHRNLGGKMVPFAGFDMPVQYIGVKAETLAVRSGCGLFDVGHMGQLDVSGPGVTEALNKVVSADWSKVRVGRAAYALLVNEEGGVQDDIMGYHLADEHWLVVVNASRSEEDQVFFRQFLPSEIALSSRIDDQGMIAVQGPHAEKILQQFCAADLSAMTLRDVIETDILGQKTVVTRGGYTGCDGFEWMGDAQSSIALWENLVAAGAVPCGLGARDVLRLEAGLPLYGHELREAWTPDESGVSFAVKTEKGPFVGSDALLAKRETPNTRTVRGLKMLGRAIPREGYAVQSNGAEIGVVTSGTLSPTLDIGIALALLPKALPLGSQVEVAIRAALHPAEIVTLPFVPRSTKPNAQ